MDTKLLEGIGLTNGEIKVYIALINLGEVTTGKIINKSQLSGSKIYQILDKLIEKGLVTYIVKEKVKYFHAENPKKILEYIQTQKDKINKKEEEVSKFLPELIKLHKIRQPDYEATIYKGIEGFKTAIFDTIEQLDENDEWIAFGASSKISKSVAYVWTNFNKQLKKKRIPVKIIINNKDAMKDIYSNNFQIKLLENTASAPMSISKNIVIIYNWEDFSIIKITNKNVADSFRNFFNSLWKIAKEIK